MEYEQLLEQAYNELKPVTSGNDLGRWQIPKLDVQISGVKTVICNFSQVASFIRRKEEHIAKFLSKELASYCKQEGDKLILNRKISKERIEEKLKVYINKFVICPECKKPDTEFEKQEGLLFLKCLACGARHSLGRV
jgi:translation initiation factor 2 subunit 2